MLALGIHIRSVNPSSHLGFWEFETWRARMLMTQSPTSAGPSEVLRGPPTKLRDHMLDPNY